MKFYIDVLLLKSNLEFNFNNFFKLILINYFKNIIIFNYYYYYINKILISIKKKTNEFLLIQNY